MTYFVWHTSYKYDPERLDEFASENDVLAFLNAGADNPDFKFRVVQGQEIKFKAAQVAVRYEKA